MQNIKLINSLGQEVPIKLWKFPAGEVGTRIDVFSPEYRYHHNFTIKVKNDYSSDTIMAITMLAATVAKDHKEVDVYLPYMPYSRQDRACSAGEVCSKQVLVDILKVSGVNRIYTEDVHSKDTLVSSIPLTKEDVLNKFPDTETIILPDSGAFAKYKSIFKGFNIVRGEKVRDPETGYITDYKLYGKVQGETTVVDDICDGGRTFIELCKSIGPTKENLNLYVTHGIFSKSIELLESYYDKVAFKNKVQPHV